MDGRMHKVVRTIDHSCVTEHVASAISDIAYLYIVAFVLPLMNPK